MADQFASKQVTKIPAEYLCPITKKIMYDPIVVDGRTYEREAFIEWRLHNRNHPGTSLLIQGGESSRELLEDKITNFLRRNPEFYNINDTYYPKIIATEPDSVKKLFVDAFLLECMYLIQFDLDLNIYEFSFGVYKSSATLALFDKCKAVLAKNWQHTDFPAKLYFSWNRLIARCYRMKSYLLGESGIEPTPEVQAAGELPAASTDNHQLLRLSVALPEPAAAAQFTPAFNRGASNSTHFSTHRNEKKQQPAKDKIGLLERKLHP